MCFDVKFNVIRFRVIVSQLQRCIAKRRTGTALPFEPSAEGENKKDEVKEDVYLLLERLSNELLEARDCAANFVSDSHAFGLMSVVTSAVMDVYRMLRGGGEARDFSLLHARLLGWDGLSPRAEGDENPQLDVLLEECRSFCLLIIRAALTVSPLSVCSWTVL